MGLPKPSKLVYGTPTQWEGSSASSLKHLFLCLTSQAAEPLNLAAKQHGKSPEDRSYVQGFSLNLSALVIEKRLCPKASLRPPGRRDSPGNLALPILLALFYPPTSISRTSRGLCARLSSPSLISLLDSVVTSALQVNFSISSPPGCSFNVCFVLFFFKDRFSWGPG